MDRNLWQKRSPPTVMFAGCAPCKRDVSFVGPHIDMSMGARGPCASGPLSRAPNRPEKNSGVGASVAGEDSADRISARVWTGRLKVD